MKSLWAGLMAAGLAGCGAPGEPAPAREVPPVAAALPGWDGLEERFSDSELATDLDSAEFAGMIARAEKWTPEEISRAIAENAESARAMWERPQKVRGRWFRLSGQLVEIYPEVTTAEGRPRDLWMVVMRDSDTREPVHFYMAERPARAGGGPFPRKEVRDGNSTYGIIDGVWVEVQGVFLRRRRFETLRMKPDGTPLVKEAAVLIVRGFRELPAPGK
jgi:hypothetical protein